LRAAERKVESKDKTGKETGKVSQEWNVAVSAETELCHGQQQ
jgi:hypothetical protein